MKRTFWLTMMACLPLACTKAQPAMPGNGARDTDGGRAAVAGPAAAITEKSGNNQTGLVGTMLASPFAVQVTDAHGLPVAGFAVNWRASAGEGSIVSTSATGVDGIAVATATLGTSAGAESFSATVDGLSGSPVTFKAVALSATIAQEAGNNQTGVIGTALATPLAVRLRDSNGNPVSGFLVQWACTVGGGTIPSTSLTGTDGVAIASVTLAATPGMETFIASAPQVTGSPVQFVANAVGVTSGSGSASTSSINASPQSVWADGLAAATITVKIEDAEGRPVFMQPVLLDVTAPGSVLDPLSGITDSSGTFVARLTSMQGGNVEVTALAGNVRLDTTIKFTNPPCASPKFLARKVGDSTDITNLAVGDFNGDGKLDIVVATSSSPGPALTMILGSTGTWREEPPIADVPVSSMATGDFNGDGKLDLVVCGYDQGYGVSTLLGDGVGGLTSVGIDRYDTGSASGGESLATGDFNGDGKLDLAVADGAANNVAVLLGDGAGGFKTADGGPIGIGADARSVVAGDFNGDGKLDLAVANYMSRSVSILLGDGNGGFADAPGSPTSIPLNPQVLAAGDFNGDGKLDLGILGSVQGNQAADGVVDVMIGKGAGGFVLTRATPLQVPEGFSMAAGDFTGDGRIDLAYSTSTSVYVLPGDGGGWFTSTAPDAPADWGLDVFDDVTNGLGGPMVIGDFDGDGTLDIAVTPGRFGGPVSGTELLSETCQ